MKGSNLLQASPLKPRSAPCEPRPGSCHRKVFSAISNTFSPELMRSQTNILEIDLFNLSRLFSSHNKNISCCKHHLLFKLLDHFFGPNLRSKVHTNAGRYYEMKVGLFNLPTLGTKNGFLDLPRSEC